MGHNLLNRHPVSKFGVGIRGFSSLESLKVCAGPSLGNLKSEEGSIHCELQRTTTLTSAIGILLASLPFSLLVLLVLLRLPLRLLEDLNRK